MYCFKLSSSYVTNPRAIRPYLTSDLSHHAINQHETNALSFACCWVGGFLLFIHISSSSFFVLKSLSDVITTIKSSHDKTSIFTRYPLFYSAPNVYILHLHLFSLGLHKSPVFLKRILSTFFMEKMDVLYFRIFFWKYLLPLRIYVASRKAGNETMCFASVDVQTIGVYRLISTTFSQMPGWIIYSLFRAAQRWCKNRMSGSGRFYSHKILPTIDFYNSDISCEL